MWTYQNNLGLNLYIVSPMSYMVTILEDGLVRSYVTIDTSWIQYELGSRAMIV